MTRTAVQIRKGAAKLFDLKDEFDDPALGADTCERLYVDRHPPIVSPFERLVNDPSALTDLLSTIP
jgi:hypothetical protein